MIHFHIDDHDSFLLVSNYTQNHKIRLIPIRTILKIEIGNLSTEIELDKIQLSVEKLIVWSSQNYIQLNALNQFFLDLIEISNKWNELENYKTNLFLIILKFLEN